MVSALRRQRDFVVSALVSIQPNSPIISFQTCHSRVQIPEAAAASSTQLIRLARQLPLAPKPFPQPGFFLFIFFFFKPGPLTTFRWSLPAPIYLIYMIPQENVCRVKPNLANPIQAYPQVFPPRQF